MKLTVALKRPETRAPDVSDLPDAPHAPDAPDAPGLGGTRD